ncbi:MAG: hypothetical protein KIS81_08935 [Maricaulaceae bacterium]|nr:hypothetical protein [Maricaulaceae bacterium]
MARPFLTSLACAGAALAAVAASAAAQTQPTRPQPRPETLQIQPDTLRQVIQDRLTQAEPAQPRRDPTPSDPVVAPVNWTEAVTDVRRQQAAAQDTRVAAVTPQAAAVRPTNIRAQDMATPSLPVLLPQPQTTIAQMGAAPQVLLFPREHFYTASMSGGGYLVEVFGTRLVHAPPAGAMQRTPRLMAADPDRYLAVRTEGGWDINFTRYGAAYTVTLECDNPEDARCATDTWAREIARSLLIAGGAPGPGDAQ